MSKPTDWDAFLPDAKVARAALQSKAPYYFACPKGHGLPHRRAWGRCSAFDCCDEAGAAPEHQMPPEAEPYPDMDLLPRGEERRAMSRKVEGPGDAERLEAMAEESVLLMQQAGRAMARASFHPFPELPPP